MDIFGWSIRSTKPQTSNSEGTIVVRSDDSDNGGISPAMSITIELVKWGVTIGLSYYLSRQLVSMLNETAGASAKGDDIPMTPTSGWENKHLKDCYLGITAENDDYDEETGEPRILVSWSADINIVTRDESKSPMEVTGYMRWRVINAVPFPPSRTNFSMSCMSGWIEKVEGGWEVDEVFSGYFDKIKGMLQVNADSVRAVPGNALEDTNQLIANPSTYSFVLIHDGREMIGRSVTSISESLSVACFQQLSCTRCVAY
jgi:hypothetical protein